MTKSLMIEIQAPHRVDGHYNSLPKIFLGGSIEMNTAEKWQEKFVQDMANEDVVLFNPRRDDWDSSIVQRESDHRFAEQVNWELDSLGESDIVIFYFDPNTKSPITLMELGIFSTMPGTMGPEVIVCCPDGFWRKGNVEILCSRNGIPLVNTYSELLATAKSLLAQIK